jgi:peptidoglycan/xylan/chitin deacetylase (PgdA/CDA1 family)
LTHDVDTERGQSKVPELVDLERREGFRSSFNFVPERYKVSAELRRDLEKGGFEVGVHGLNHDGKYFNSREIFRYRATRINHYLKEWNAVGFRMPAMHYRLDWLLDLQVEYDASTFDTDPFEPYSEGMGTIFPFLVPGENGNPGYIELPYTLPQDFLLFVMLCEKDTSIWKRKLDWVVAHGGMALMNTHPDYMSFRGNCSIEEYPSDRYLEILQYIKTRYAGMYWNVLPREVARYFRESITS